MHRLAAPDFLLPDWPAPAHVRALSTSRGLAFQPEFGDSAGIYAALNLGTHVGDAPAAVLANRQLLQQFCDLPRQPAWLNQVHGVAVLDLDWWQGQLTDADASVTSLQGLAAVVMTADCLPVLFCDRQGRKVAAAHAGWRGLCDGVLEATLQHFPEPADVLAWLGPAIGPVHFEVGNEVRAAFMAKDPQAATAFVPSHNAGKYLADIYLLAQQRLQAAGVSAIYGGDYCTVADPQRFFSYRRDGQTGRQASLIWLTAAI
ncbi:MAG: peptidoglycan editing factor PgeF [Rheinheimera sp.]|nr:peptidoglycan editing factor PgeF [Rheinheimera sp.]